MRAERLTACCVDLMMGEGLFIAPKTIEVALNDGIRSTFEPGAIDFIVSSRFTHHLADSEVVRFLRWMDQHAVRGWFINDLHRHPLPSFLIRHATRLFRFDRMVRYDG